MWIPRIKEEVLGAAFVGAMVLCRNIWTNKNIQEVQKYVEEQEEHRKDDTFKISEFWEFTLLIHFPNVTQTYRLQAGRLSIVSATVAFAINSFKILE